jgi:hypothetical protein
MNTQFNFGGLNLDLNNVIEVMDQFRGPCLRFENVNTGSKTERVEITLALNPRIAALWASFKRE